jgi:hypothetical protein
MSHGQRTKNISPIAKARTKPPVSIGPTSIPQIVEFQHFNVVLNGCFNIQTALEKSATLLIRSAVIDDSLRHSILLTEER